MDILKKHKYIFYLIGSVFTLLVGSFIGILTAYVFAKAKYSYDYETFTKLLSYFANFYSKTLTENGELTCDIIQAFFSENPVMFEHAKVIATVNQFASYIPSIIFIFACLGKELKEDFQKIKKEPIRFILTIVVAAVSMYALSFIVTIIYEMLGVGGSSDNENTIALMMDSKGIWLMTFSVVILAPIVEEFIFRKLMIDSFEKTFKINPLIAVGISTILFALIHVSDCQNIKYIFQYIALALPLCLSYHFTRNNIVTSIVVHMINNAIVAIAYILLIFGNA